MNRRTFLQSLCQASLLAIVPWSTANAAPGMELGRVFHHPKPGSPGWPSERKWEALKKSVGGRLVQPLDPIRETTGQAQLAAVKNAENPFYLQENPGVTQSTGWSNAWESRPSAWAVTAESAEDVAAAVNFARAHGLRLVVKGGGHDYLGRSSAEDALLIWTHKMRDVRVQADFVPEGAPGGTEGRHAVSVGAGTRWVEAYGAVTTQAGRYVQGGGCASVGVAGGFTQGCGFGSFSKKFGTGAAGILEVEIVTADGEIKVVNEYQEPELFWAVRGGGGGTFGVVTRMTLMTHDLPAHFALITGKVTAESDAAFRNLVERFCQFYHDELNNEHWGEQFALQPDNSITFFLTCQGLDQRQIDLSWSSLEEWLNEGQSDYNIERETIMIPPQNMWNYDWWGENHPEIVTKDSRPGQDGKHYWWTSNGEEVGMYWYTYQSRYVPLNLFQQREREHFAQRLFDASRIRSVSLHINKGLAGSSTDAIRRGRETSVNPIVYDAAALVILGAGKRAIYPGVKGYEPDDAISKREVEKVEKVMSIMRELAPNSGSYANEADFFTKDWQREFWGENYPRLLEIKNKVDPTCLFHCHHAVGSEGWSQDGMKRTL